MSTRPLFEYDIYFPLGHPNAADALVRWKRELTHRFGGITDFRHRSEGAWKVGGVTFHDEIVLLRVLGDDRDNAREFLSRMAGELERTLEEREILIIERAIVALGTNT